jgi:hypothetical protein
MSSIEGRITVTIRYFFDQTGERDEKTRKNIVKMVLPSLSEDGKPLEMIPISNILKSLERDGVFLSDLQSIRYFDAVDEGYLRIDLGDEEGFGQAGCKSHRNNFPSNSKLDLSFYSPSC